MIIYTAISLCARSLFHAYIGAWLYIVLGYKKYLILPILVLLAAKEAVDLMLARPEALGTVANMGKNILVLAFCAAGYGLALKLRTTRYKPWSVVVVALSILIALALSFLLTQTILAPVAAPWYKSILDVVSFALGGYWLENWIQKAWRADNAKNIC